MNFHNKLKVRAASHQNLSTVITLSCTFDNGTEILSAHYLEQTAVIYMMGHDTPLSKYRTIQYMCFPYLMGFGRHKLELYKQAVFPIKFWRIDRFSIKRLRALNP
jgi:hypothetical protein